MLTVKRLIKNILSGVWLQYNDDLILQPDLKPLHLLAMAKARVAELVDAADSKSAVRKDVSVRLRSRAPVKYKSHAGQHLQGFFCSGAGTGAGINKKLI